MCSSATLFAVIISAITALSSPISNAGSFSVPARYAWSFENWSGGWYVAGWANFQISAPEATSGDVVIPELSLTGICHIVGHGGETSNCNDLIEDNTDGRSLLFTLRPFDASIQEVQLDATYRFKSGGR
jgi:hypothetical protein